MHITSGRSCDLSQTLRVALSQYRHKIFIERLGWSLPVVNGMESDQFDHPETLYVIAHEKDGAITGCARLLPTESPYLLSEIFPHLLAGLSIPRARDVWELSRFSAAPIDAHAHRDGAVLTRSLLAAAVKCAAEQGATRLITVSPLGIERLLVRMGVHSHRAGPPTLIDGKPVFACWIEIDEQTLTALNIKAVSNSMEPIFDTNTDNREKMHSPQPEVPQNCHHYR
jgi:acyl homoserine lactone synthase